MEILIKSSKRPEDEAVRPGDLGRQGVQGGCGQARPDAKRWHASLEGNRNAVTTKTGNVQIPRFDR